MQAARCPAFAPRGNAQLRVGRAALGDRDRATGVEAAARGNGDRVRRLAAEDLGLGRGARVALRHDRDEGLRVRVLRVRDDLARRPFLDDPAQVHDRDPVREVSGRGEIVGDHEDAEAAAPQLVEEREDPGADGDVEHGDRLVGDEQLRVEHEARGDGNPLALAARELVWKAVEEELRGGQPRSRQRIADAVLPLLAAAALSVDEQGLLDGGAHAKARVERLVGILEDELGVAAEPPHLAPGCGRDVLALEADRPRVGLDEPEDRLRRRGLAASRLAHEREHLSLVEREGHPVDGADGQLRPAGDCSHQPSWNGEAGDEVLDLEQGMAVPGRQEAARTAGSLRWHAAAWPWSIVSSRGFSDAHGEKARSQRGANGQPTSSRSRGGGVPGMDTTASSP